MTDSSPWNGITIPKADFNVRRVAVGTAVPCFWGRDTNGCFLFIVELQGDHVDQYRKNAVTVNGINVDLRAGEREKQLLILTLEKQVDRDLFEGLCSTLVSSLENTTNSASALAVSLTHIRRWKTFLSGRNQLMSAEEIRGLFAEIVFLMELLERQIPSNTAVDAWLGPERSHQDFIFGNTAVEVKSLSGAERSSIHISSEDQLESLNDSLFLRVYRLSNLPEATAARSLNELIISVQTRLGEVDAIEAFDRKLVAYGYAPLPDYDQPRFVVSNMSSYRVGDGFPRLMRSQLPVGIAKVTYDIRLETIAPYQCDDEAIFGED
ncbi:PD-(D/E)XK motif protein [Dickeya fangzhongdai]|uniref:PD-(D/E)XK motif protein n=1 Tax=Dickeya fangzhongdai TaxID=1778540 RepID=UPI0026E0090E|nr:PD-(D/E)XK motif protein [Dickeya fangzhongdai]WKV52375.1 PD-(D/E)XK motif protein [Dickeya fangzhongdai]